MKPVTLEQEAEGTLSVLPPGLKAPPAPSYHPPSPFTILLPNKPSAWLIPKKKKGWGKGRKRKRRRVAEWLHLQSEITTGLGLTFSFKEPESGFLGPPKGEQMQGDQDVLTSFMQAGGET